MKSRSDGCTLSESPRAEPELGCPTRQVAWDPVHGGVFRGLSVTGQSFLIDADVSKHRRLIQASNHTNKKTARSPVHPPLLKTPNPGGSALAACLGRAVPPSITTLYQPTPPSHHAVRPGACCGAGGCAAQVCLHVPPASSTNPPVQGQVGTG